MRGAIKQLPSPEREVAEAVCIGKSNAEIAGELGLRPRAVLRLYRLALGRLRALLNARPQSAGAWRKQNRRRNL